METDFKKCCFTGYRPSKFPFALDGNNRQYNDFENRLTDTVFNLIENGCYTFYSGMAMGFDIIAAETVLLAKSVYKYASIELYCAVPFIGQTAAYTDEWRHRYNSVMENADGTILVSDKYFKGCYQKRNEFMVNTCDTVVTWFDGKSGGTKNTLAFAQKKGREIINLNTAEPEIQYEYCYEIIDDEE